MCVWAGVGLERQSMIPVLLAVVFVAIVLLIDRMGGDQ